jgi:hypothetical protein
VTGPARDISIDAVTSYGGAGRILGIVSDLTLSNQVVIGAGCGS